MKIPLDEFEQLIDDKILKRGLAYFRKGAVIDFSKIDTKVYEAIVSGTENYVVHLEISNNTIVTDNCSCPYIDGPVCKHIVAVIFYILQEELNLNKPNVSKPKISKPRSKKTKSIPQQVKELLKAVSHEELIEFVQESTKKDKVFRNYLLASFEHLSTDKSKKFYKKQIHSILKTASGRDGWIDWANMKYVVNNTEMFLEKAKEYMASDNFENVFFISTALLEKMTEAFDYADDSNGDLGYFIDSAMVLLTDLIKEKLPDSLKKELFTYCITSFKQNIFKGWDWHLGILEIACKLIDDESKLDTITACLDSFDGGYEQQRAQSFKLDLLQKFKTEKEVEEYINKHISNSSIRTKEIEKAFVNKNFERVITLAEDGIKCDEKDKPGLVGDWYNWLLEVAQEQNNIPQIIEYARFLFIENSHPTQNYYQILKDTIECENWHPFLEELIKEIKSNPRWTYSELIRSIYIKEEWWDRLFLMLKENISLQDIEQNEQYLSKDYSLELVELYSKRITNYVENYVDRKNYKKACGYLRRMKKLGGNKQVNDLIELFRGKYPKRKALLDELTQV